MPAATAPKDPAKIRAGIAGANARWGEERRIIRLDELTPPQRVLVVALIEAARAQNSVAERHDAEPAPGSAPLEVASGQTTSTPTRRR